MFFFKRCNANKKESTSASTSASAGASAGTGTSTSTRPSASARSGTSTSTGTGASASARASARASTGTSTRSRSRQTVVRAEATTDATLRAASADWYAVRETHLRRPQCKGMQWGLHAIRPDATNRQVLHKEAVQVQYVQFNRMIVDFTIPIFSSDILGNSNRLLYDSYVYIYIYVYILTALMSSCALGMCC